jgi:oligopeptide/dipeptide ABC transporter ATP-binding protein
MTAQPILDIRRLTRDYADLSLLSKGPANRALDDLSMTVEKGTIHGIVGESGCGKSTLARIVMALDRPTSGKVIFEGEDLFHLGERELRRKRRDFQMVFQDPFGSLDPRHHVGRIIAEPLHLLETRPSRAAARDKVAEVLESVGLDPSLAERYPHEFSGGQRQRIAIARALITEPKLAVADEAVSALDLSVQAQVLNLLMDLRDKRGITFLFITHNLAVVHAIADSVGVMYRGRIVEAGPAREILDNPLHPYTKMLADAELNISTFGRPERRAPSMAVTADNGKGCSFRGRCPMAIARCADERPELRAVLPGRRSACHRAEALLPPDAGA